MSRADLAQIGPIVSKVELQQDFAAAWARYCALHESHTGRLRMAVLWCAPLDIATFSAETDELEAARDELYAKARPFLLRNSPMLGRRHGD